MMATEEKPVDEVHVAFKMEGTATGLEESKEDENIRDVIQTETTKLEEQESKMEVEVSQIEETLMADVTMETETAPSQENKKEDATFLVEQKLRSDETTAQEMVAQEKTEEVQQKETVVEDKVDDLKSASPGQVKDEPLKITEELAEELADEWDILGTDDEKEESGDKKTSGAWMPDVNVIIDLYKKLDKEGVLELQWKCPGRRPPPEEVDEKEETEKAEKEIEKPEAKEEKQEEEPTEFDFDVDTPSITSMAPRRTPGSGTALGSGKKRVARMDKIFNDMLRHKRIDEELARVGDESDDVISRTDTTPQRPVAKFRIRKDF